MSRQRMKMKSGHTWALGLLISLTKNMCFCRHALVWRGSAKSVAGFDLLLMARAQHLGSLLDALASSFYEFTSCKCIIALANAVFLVL